MQKSSQLRRRPCVRALVYSGLRRDSEAGARARPECESDGVVIAVRATGVCRSDWHAWKGHDPVAALPHIPGHEMAERSPEVGAGVRALAGGNRSPCALCVAAVSVSTATAATRRSVLTRHSQASPAPDLSLRRVAIARRT